MNHDRIVPRNESGKNPRPLDKEHRVCWFDAVWIGMERIELEWRRSNWNVPELWFSGKGPAINV
jgi:hypothetical protein